MRRKCGTWLAAAALVTWTVALGAQESGTRTVSDGDKTFVKEAASGGLAEVKLGEIALKRSSDAEVKAFAQRMIDDHSRADAELRTWRPRNRSSCQRMWTPGSRRWPIVLAV